MAKYSNFDKRMKRYEASSDIVLTRRMPVVLRFDGSHFHTFTRGFKKPFDEILIKTMQDTMLDLCKNIQGAVFGYTQSDEITIILIDYQTLESNAWFNYRLEKMCSIGSSMASRFFNQHFIENVELFYGKRRMHNWQTQSIMGLSQDELRQYNIYKKRYFSADFDCRAYNIPKEDICNCVLWRQKDAAKNSVQSLAQSMYSASELKGISCENLKAKLLKEKGINWDDLPTIQRHGSACRKCNKVWDLDVDMPNIQLNREYVEKVIYI